jgi:hypothetical protein
MLSRQPRNEMNLIIYADGNDERMNAGSPHEADGSTKLAEKLNWRPSVPQVNRGKTASAELALLQFHLGLTDIDRHFLDKACERGFRESRVVGIADGKGNGKLVSRIAVWS